MSKKEIVLTILFLLLLFTGYFLLRHHIYGTPWRDLALEAFIILAIFAFSILKRLVPVLETITSRGIYYYLAFTMIYVALLYPAYGSYLAAEIATNSASPELELAFFIFAAVVWLTMAFSLIRPRLKEWLFTKLRILGWHMPMIFLFNYIAISIILFGFFAFYLFGTGPDGSLDSEQYLKLFFYHFLDSIPALKIPETIDFDEPLADARPENLGYLLLLFKFAVLVQGVGAFRAYWKSSSGGDATS